MLFQLTAPIEWVAGLFPLLPRPGQPVVFMFTDIQGFTRHAAGAGDGAAVRLLGRHDRAVLPALRRHGGRVVKRLGDGLMAVFATPGEALVAALAMQRAATDDPHGMVLRIGLHVGRARVRAGDLIGHDVNVAARIADRAPGGRVLVSDPIRAAAAHLAVRFRRRGALVVGGQTTPLFHAEESR
jgi:adenylate cyclase